MRRAVFISLLAIFATVGINLSVHATSPVTTKAPAVVKDSRGAKLSSAFATASCNQQKLSQCVAFCGHMPYPDNTTCVGGCFKTYCH